MARVILIISLIFFVAQAKSNPNGYFPSAWPECDENLLQNSDSFDDFRKEVLNFANKTKSYEEATNMRMLTISQSYASIYDNISHSIRWNELPNLHPEQVEACENLVSESFATRSKILLSELNTQRESFVSIYQLELKEELVALLDMASRLELYHENEFAKSYLETIYKEVCVLSKQLLKPYKQFLESWVLLKNILKKADECLFLNQKNHK